MSKLLTANFMRLKKDKILWIASAAMLIISAYSIIVSGMTMRDIDDANNVQNLNSVYFNFCLLPYFFIPYLWLFLQARNTVMQR